LEARVDARGLMCPEPVLLARRAMEQSPGGAIEVLVDNNAAMENVSRLAGKMGWSVTVEGAGSEYLLRLTK